MYSTKKSPINFGKNLEKNNLHDTRLSGNMLII